MKIEWLNKNKTEARITRGWWRKRVAKVVWHCNKYGESDWYWDTDTDRILRVFTITSWRINRKRFVVWHNPGQLPQAKVVKS